MPRTDSGSQTAPESARQLAAWLRERFGDRMADIRLFGSWARGEADEDSDVDVLVVFEDPPTRVMSLFDREFVLTGEMERRHGKAFHDLFDARNRSDYALGVRPHEEEAKQALALAEEFVTVVGARLGPG